MADLDTEIADHAAGVLLRYFRAVAAVESQRPALSNERDRELLRMHWALSPKVADLAAYVVERGHEIQTVLASVARIEDAAVRGRLDAGRTLSLRRTSGLATAVVGHEPLRSYLSGPNHLLGWVLAQAYALSQRFAALAFDSPGYRAAVDHALRGLTAARKVQGIAQIMAQVALARRPSAGSLGEASRSRRALYRKAADAYCALLDVEAGMADAINAMLRHTLLGPLEPWRRFELAIGLSVGEALAHAQQAPLVLNLLAGDVRRPLAQAGRFSVFWQWPTLHHTAPAPEPSEIVTAEILSAYGLSGASDRPDLVVTDSAANGAAAIVEIKYLTGEDASDRVRSAASQVVRYSRGYASLAKGAALRGRSLLVMSQGIDDLTVPDPLPPAVPLLCNFWRVKEGSLAPWAQRLTSPPVP